VADDYVPQTAPPDFTFVFIFMASSSPYKTEFAAIAGSEGPARCPKPRRRPSLWFWPSSPISFPQVVGYVRT